MTEKNTIPKGYWETADGSLIPESKVSDLDKARDAVVKTLIKAAEDMNGQLAQFKALAMKEVQNFVDLSATQYGVQIRGAAGKGNVTLTSFDGRFKVEKQIAEHITFDERLQVAKAAIDECLLRWGKGANDNIKALVNHAFAVDKAGKVSVRRILDLRAVKIVDEKWQAAMDALADSMTTASSTAYVRFYKRDDDTGQYLPISLNVAAL